MGGEGRREGDERGRGSGCHEEGEVQVEEGTWRGGGAGGGVDMERPRRQGHCQSHHRQQQVEGIQVHSNPTVNQTQLEM